MGLRRGLKNSNPGYIFTDNIETWRAPFSKLEVWGRVVGEGSGVGQGGVLENKTKQKQRCLSGENVLSDQYEFAFIQNVKRRREAWKKWGILNSDKYYKVMQAVIKLYVIYVIFHKYCRKRCPLRTTSTQIILICKEHQKPGQFILCFIAPKRIFTKSRLFNFKWHFVVYKKHVFKINEFFCGIDLSWEKEYLWIRLQGDNLKQNAYLCSPFKAPFFSDWGKLEPMTSRRAFSEDSNQTARILRLTWVLAGAHVWYILFPPSLIMDRTNYEFNLLELHFFATLCIPIHAWRFSWLYYFLILRKSINVTI